jgi:hypothetical protein
MDEQKPKELRCSVSACRKRVFRDERVLLGCPPSPDALRRHPITYDPMCLSCFQAQFPSDNRGIQSSQESELIFCDCRIAFAEWEVEEKEMVECDICGQWYHVECLNPVDVERIRFQEEIW